MDSPTPSLNMAALKDIDFVTEGRLALKDVSFALLHGEISASLPCTKDQVYLNLTTKENAKFCVCLSHRGFQVVGNDHDEAVTVETRDSVIFETVYSLLQNISPSYTQQFSDQLISKLAAHCDDTRQ